MLSSLILLPIQSYLLVTFFQLFNNIQIAVQIFVIFLLSIEIIVNVAIIKSSLKERALKFQMEYNKKRIISKNGVDDG